MCDTAKGTVTGFDGCNRRNGTFTFDVGRLKAKTATTRMACASNAARQASTAIGDLLGNGVPKWSRSRSARDMCC